jgi:NtrC-family two-component system sensor histidine kinase KinB
MTLRAKLLWTQVPLLVTLVFAGIVSSLTLAAVGRRSELILEDNYRSVLAAQRMKESAERIDSSTLFVLVGRADVGTPSIDAHIEDFERELGVQASNVTEPGEDEAVARLQAAWSDYRAHVSRLLGLEDRAAVDALYFDELMPRFHRVKSEADAILAMNQDAMVRKSEAAKREAARSNTMMLVALFAGTLIAIVVSTKLTTRLLRPLSVLSQAVRRVGEGDLAVRAQVTGRDEVAELARELNAMAEHLERYQRSTLGELLEAQQAAQAAIDSLADPVVVLAPGGEVLNVNRAAEVLLGIGVEVRVGHPLDAADPGVRDALIAARDHVLGGKGPYLPQGLEQAFRAPTAEGDRHFLTRATPVYSEAGSVVAATVVLQDVSRLLRMDELKTNLVATVAHEFRTALTSLRMAIHLCVEQVVGPLTEKQADLLYAAREDCERLQTLVDEILDLSRIREGRIELRKARIEAEALVRAAVEHHEDEAEARSVRLRAEVLPGTGTVEADPERIALTFDNLLVNALRYAPAGTEVVVRAEAGDGVVRFEVIDQGPGIPPELLPTMFQRHVQQAGATGRAGLGLSIARESVQAHGGDIGAESRPGQGTTVWFTLPLA